MEIAAAKMPANINPTKIAGNNSIDKFGNANSGSADVIKLGNNTLAVNPIPTAATKFIKLQTKFMLRAKAILSTESIAIALTNT